jgi:hypothetical protein
LRQVLGQCGLGRLLLDLAAELVEFFGGQALRQQVAPVPRQLRVFRNHLGDVVLGELLLD